MKKKWNYETCKEVAEKCKTYREFCLKYPGAYDVANKNGWEFIERKTKKSGYWNYENCKKVAEKCKDTTEFFKKYPSAYDASRKKKWIWDWFERKCYGRNYWTYEKCLEESKKYKTYSEFRDNSNVAYEKSKRKNDWIKDFIWLENDLKTYDTISKKHLIYKYFFKETNSIYIGLTKNLKERNENHRNKNKKSSVLLHSIENNINIPNIEIIEDNLTIDEAKIREEYWVNYYYNNGFNIINKAKTGLKSSSTGGCIRKWTYEKCLEEAKKYNSRTDFQKSNGAAYNSALKNNWLQEYDWLKPKIHPNGYWSFEQCLEEAKKYKSYNDFRKNSMSAYISVNKNKWNEKIKKIYYE